MSELVDVAGLDDLQDGQMTSVTVKTIEILLANVKGTIYATDNLCPHMKGKLAKGNLEGSIVTCPKHGSQFDVTTGENIRWLKGSGPVAAVAKAIKPPKTIKTYKTEIKDGRIFVEI